jgi:hypothetical protein
MLYVGLLICIGHKSIWNFKGKGYGMKWGAICEYVGEHIENLGNTLGEKNLRTSWEQSEHFMRTTEIQHPYPPPKEKKPGAPSPHWL